MVGDCHLWLRLSFKNYYLGHISTVNTYPHYYVKKCYFRALLEVKYKESGLLEGSQTRKYIDELARPYTELPGYETTWPPFLVVASLSTNAELRYFDDGGATLQYAEQNGINVFHVTLQRDVSGQMYLKGRTVGTVTIQRNSDGSLVQRPASDTITESYEFNVLCSAEEAE